MNITEAIANVRACGANVGLTRKLGEWDDEDLIIFALNFLSANIEDAIYEDDEEEETNDE